jgi:hypothetical protein
MAFSGLAILIAGITIGAAGAVVFIRPVDRQPPADVDAAVTGMVGWFRDALSLSHEQMTQIEAIVRLRMGNLEDIRREARPKIEEELQAMKREIDEVLTETQRNDWQRITERLDMEFRRGMRRGGPGGPGEGFRDGGRRRSPRGEDGDDIRRGGRLGTFDSNDPRRRDWRGDTNDPRRPQVWWADPNNPRRQQDWRGDPNGPPWGGGSRPQWQGPEGERRPFNRGPDANDRRPDPNMRNMPFGPPDMFLGFGGL